MRTITLEVQMTFNEALNYLMEGKCIGIKPKGNGSFLVKYKPHWMNKDSSDYILCWNRTYKDGEVDQGIRTNQYLDEWNPVIIDCNNLPEDINNQFIWADISSLVK